VIYTMMLDETLGLDPEVRAKHRWNLDFELDKPLDAEEAREYEDEHWGLEPDAIAAAEAADELFVMDGEE
jgi:hypothetical protein